MWMRTQMNWNTSGQMSSGKPLPRPPHPTANSAAFHNAPGLICLEACPSSSTSIYLLQWSDSHSSVYRARDRSHVKTLLNQNLCWKQRQPQISDGAKRRQNNEHDVNAAPQHQRKSPSISLHTRFDGKYLQKQTGTLISGEKRQA